MELPFDLKSIIKDIKVAEKKERKETLTSIVEEGIRFNERDRTEVIFELKLTRYQVYWLMWRIKVHLKSYGAFEWSEMKDVLENILKPLCECWEKSCLSSDVKSVEENSPSGRPTHVDSV